MYQPVSLRLPPAMHAEIEAIMQERALQGAEKAAILRELIALGLAARRGKK